MVIGPYDSETSYVIGHTDILNNAPEIQLERRITKEPLSSMDHKTFLDLCANKDNDIHYIKAVHGENEFLIGPFDTGLDRLIGERKLREALFLSRILKNDDVVFQIHRTKTAEPNAVNETTFLDLISSESPL